MAIGLKVLTLALASLCYLEVVQTAETPVRNSKCIFQKDFYDSLGNYMKTACYVDLQEPRDVGSAKCADYGMNIYDPDNNAESMQVLFNRAIELVPNTQGAACWVGGAPQGGLCPILSWKAPSVFEKKYVSCSYKMGVACEFDRNAPIPVIRPAPAGCSGSLDVFAPNGQYAKTFCHVAASKSRFEAKQSCEYASMKLANSNEYIPYLYAIGSYLYPKGTFLWIDGKNGLDCTALYAPSGSSSYSILRTLMCYAKYPFVCEYNKFVPAVSPPVTSPPIVTPVKNAACVLQKDLYNADGNYFKTVCYSSQAGSRDSGAAKCDSFGMKIADPNNGAESLGVLLTYVGEASPNTPGAAAFVDGVQGGSCAVLAYKSPFIYERKYIACGSQYGAICEFDRNYVPTTTTPTTTSTTTTPTTTTPTTTTPTTTTPTTTTPTTTTPTTTTPTTTTPTTTTPTTTTPTTTTPTTTTPTTTTPTTTTPTTTTPTTTTPTTTTTTIKPVIIDSIHINRFFNIYPGYSQASQCKSFFITKTLTLTWAASKQYCLDIGMNLATFESAEEASYFLGISAGEVWVGLSDIATEGSFLQVSNASVPSKFPWYPGMPDNAGNIEDCVEAGFGNLYNDRPCDYWYRFACEASCAATVTTPAPVTTVKPVTTLPPEISSFFYTYEPYPFGKTCKKFHISAWGYYLGWDAAKIKCESLGMNLATFESYEEGNYFNGIAGGEVWVGLRDVGKEGVYVQERGVPTPKLNWYPGQPEVASAYYEDCVEGGYGGYFNDRVCSIEMRYACEKLCGPDEPAPYFTAPFDTYGPHKFGTKQKKFYVSKTQALTWSAAKAQCESFGWNLATFDTLAEAVYYNSVANGETWVGISDQAVEGTMAQVNGVPVPMLNWYPGQPDNLINIEDCVESGYGGLYNDRDCNTVMRYGCEEVVDLLAPTTTKPPTTTSTPTTTVTTTRAAPKPVPINSIYINKFFDVLPGYSQASQCKVFYITKSLSFNWAQSKQYCEDIGMNLATFESFEEAKYFMGITNGEVWVGLNDLAVEGEYVQVNNLTAPQRLPWYPGQPDDWTANQDCIEVGYGNMFADRECSYVLRFACEAACSATVTTPAPVTTVKPVTTLPPAISSFFYTYEPYQFGKTCKKYHISAWGYYLNWADSKAKCESLGMNLATFESYEEGAYFNGIAGGEVWVGINDRANEGALVQERGVPLPNLNWYPGTPDNLAGIEDCIQGGYAGYFNDRDCATIMRYACERLCAPGEPAPVYSAPFDIYGPIVNENKQKTFYITKTHALNWNAAKAFCENIGFSLATFDTFAEAVYYNSVSNGETWVGISDQALEGKMVQVNGVTVPMMNWYPGQPDNLGNIEDCVEAGYGGLYNDRDCNTVMRIGCEKVVYV